MAKNSNRLEPKQIKKGNEVRCPDVARGVLLAPTPLGMFEDQNQLPSLLIKLRLDAPESALLNRSDKATGALNVIG